MASTRGAARGIEVPERDEMVGQRSALVASPGGECRERAPWSIRPFWRASRPKSRSREGSVGWDMVAARIRSRAERCC